MTVGTPSSGEGSDRKISDRKNGIEIRPTICSICNPNTHCGIDAYVRDGMVIKVEGSKKNPQNEGVLCPKGAASRQYIYHRDRHRLRLPLIRRGERGVAPFEPVSWEAPSWKKFPGDSCRSGRSRGSNQLFSMRDIQSG